MWVIVPKVSEIQWYCMLYQVAYIRKTKTVDSGLKIRIKQSSLTPHFAFANMLYQGGVSILLLVSSASFMITLGSQLLSTSHQLDMLPIVKCSGISSDLAKISKLCLEQCPRSRDQAVVKNMRVYDKVQPTHMLSVFVCHTFEEVWNFDQSWLFSKTRNLQSRDRVVVNSTECRNLLDNVCKGTPCQISPLVTPEDEYAYATTVTKKISYSSGAVINITAIILEDGSQFLTDLPGVPDIKRADSGLVFSGDKDSLYLWDPKEFSNCPLVKWQTTQCMIKPSESIVCPDLGLNLWKPLKLQIKGCSGKEYFSDEKGVIMEIARSEDKLTQARYIDVPLQSTMSDRNLVNMMNEALRVRDELSCDHQCLELSSVPHVEDSIVSTGGSFWRYNEGSLFECHPLMNCNFESGYTVCRDPLSISLECNGEIVSWDPEKDYALAPYPCHSNKFRLDKYRIKTNQGLVLFNTSGVYLETTTGRMPKINHLSNYILNLKTKTVKEFASLIFSDDTVVNNRSVLLNREEHSPFKSVFKIPGDVLDWIENAENEFTKTVTLFLGILIFIGFVLFAKSWKEKSRKIVRISNVTHRLMPSEDIYEI